MTSCSRCGRPPESHPPQQINEEEAKVIRTTKPVRDMKARRDGTVACGHYVLQGQKIVGKGDGWRRRWICEPCAVLEVAASRETITEGKRP